MPGAALLTQRKVHSVDDARPDSPVPNLGAMLISFRRSVMTTTRERIEPFGISVEEFAMLNALRLRGSSPVTRLAHALNYQPGFVGSAAHRLTQEGLMRSRRSRTDRRVIELRLTARGTEVTAEIHDLLEVAFGELLDGATPDQVEAFVDVIHIVRDNFQRLQSAQEAAAAEGADGEDGE